MDFFQENFSFTVKNKAEFEHKISHYFESYNFKKTKVDEHHFIFYKKGSLLDGWKINPLNWKSKIEIKHTNNQNILIKYYVDGNAHITPIAFTPLFDDFILNLQNYIDKNIDFKSLNNPKISLAKKKTANFMLLLLIGTFAGLCVGFLIEKYIGGKFSAHFAVPIAAILSLKLLNNCLKEKYSYYN